MKMLYVILFLCSPEKLANGDYDCVQPRIGPFAHTADCQSLGPKLLRRYRQQNDRADWELKAATCWIERTKGKAI